MPDCRTCDADVATKNNAGHYRDQCRDCLRAVAEAQTPHHKQCNDEECIVCQSYWEEQLGGR